MLWRGENSSLGCCQEAEVKLAWLLCSTETSVTLQGTPQSTVGLGF